jgi:pentatricopeptide repeat protein
MEPKLCLVHQTQGNSARPQMVDKLTGDRSIGAAVPPGNAGVRSGARIREMHGPSVQPTAHDGRARVRPGEPLVLGTIDGIREKTINARPAQPGRVDWDTGSSSSAHQMLKSLISRTGVDSSPRSREEALKFTTSLIGRCEWNEALGFMQMLREGNITPTVMNYGALMAKAKREPDARLAKVLKVSDDMRADRVEPNWFVRTSIITALGRSGRSDEAERVFREMDGPDDRADIKAFGALMSAHAMKGTLAGLEAVERLYGEIIARGLKPDPQILGTRVLAHGKAGRLGSAMPLFEKLLADKITPHLAVCNTLIAACEFPRSSELALSIFDGMIKRDTRPSSVTFSTLMRTCMASKKHSVTISAIELGKKGKVLHPSVGYDASSGHLRLWGRNVMANGEEWRCSSSDLADIGKALAEFHLGAGGGAAPSHIEGPEPARHAARRVIHEWSTVRTRA